MTLTLRLSKKWDNTDLRTHDVFWNGEPTGKQAIVYNDKLITFRSVGYHVFAHEDVLAIVDRIATALKLKLQTDGSTNHTLKVNGKDYQVTADKNIARVTAKYTFSDFDVTGNDRVKFGVSILTNIDGSGSLKICPYSFRQVCSNGMLHAASFLQISEALTQKIVKSTEKLDNYITDLEAISLDTDRLVEKLTKLGFRHKEELPANWIAARLLQIVENAKTLEQKYKQLVDAELNAKTAAELIKKIPVKVLKNLSWIEKQDKEYRYATTVTKWQALNDITYQLTHQSRAYTANLNAYKAVDEILVRA